jgi:CheY-like chemotaxis protein
MGHSCRAAAKPLPSLGLRAKWNIGCRSLGDMVKDSDISLPEMSEFALVAAIRSNPALRDLPIVAASAHITEIDKEKARRAGFDAFLAKPVEPDQLLLTIKRYLPQNRNA